MEYLDYKTYFHEEFCSVGSRNNFTSKIKIYKSLKVKVFEETTTGVTNR